MGLQWWCGVCDRAIFKLLLSQRPSCVDLKGETVGQLPIIGVGRIGKEIPPPKLELVLRHPLTRLSLLIVGGGGRGKELFAGLDIAGPLPKAIVKVWRVAGVPSERADRIFETRTGAYARLALRKYLQVLDFPGSI